jgi:hypothetical protein
MPSHRSSPARAILSALAPLWLASSLAALAADSPGLTPGNADGAAPKITAVKILELSAGDVIHRDAKATFRLAILGANLASPAAAPEILLDTGDAGHAVQHQQVIPVGSDEVDVSGEVSPGTIINAIKLSVGGKATRAPDGLTISFKGSSTPAAVKAFQVKLDARQDKEFPNLHSLLVTRESGDSGAGFAANPNHMQVKLEPAGAVDLRVVRSTEEQLELQFVAAADYLAKNAVIMVYDGSDLDLRKPVAVARVASPAPPEDLNPPKISAVETLFVDRGLGNGRIQIHGEGFGQVGPPRYPVDDYLCACLERPELSGERPKSTGQRTCGLAGNVFPPPRVAADAGKSPADRKKAARRTAKEIEAENRAAREAMEEAIEQHRDAFCKLAEPAFTAFQESLRGKVTVGVKSRNPAIRIEKVYIVDINDRMADVYFEFTRHFGYAWPFRLAGVDMTITRKVRKTEQTVRAQGVSGEVDVTVPNTFSAEKMIGPGPDPNLTFQYTVLDKDGARSLLGEGVADNFHVLQLSVVNNGKRKVAIPLAAIQAEVEWLYGVAALKSRDFRRRSAETVSYIDGPPTLAPIPLATVSAYFGMSQKSEGRRTRVFNILEGITTLATAFVPFSGPALKDAEVVLSGGFIPGMRQAWVDLSAQQLQNLTSLSWETSETVAPNGGTIEKYIYIQRKPQLIDEVEPTLRPPSRTVKGISNIMALEVNGFEIPDAPEKQATPAKP